MSKTTGKSGVDWSKAPEGATHYKIFPKGQLSLWYKEGMYWDSDNKKYCPSQDWFTKNYYKFITKEDDLEMYKQVVKQVSSVGDLETGMFVFMQDGYSAYVNKDYSGKVGFLYTHGHTDMNYLMSMNYRGLVYTPNPDVNITHWGYSLNGERYPVATSEADIKIKELEATIAAAILMHIVEEQRGELLSKTTLDLIYSFVRNGFNRELKQFFYPKKGKGND